MRYGAVSLTFPPHPPSSTIVALSAPSLARSIYSCEPVQPYSFPSPWQPSPAFKAMCHAVPFTSDKKPYICTSIPSLECFALQSMPVRNSPEAQGTAWHLHRNASLFSLSGLTRYIFTDLCLSLLSAHQNRI